MAGNLRIFSLNTGMSENLAGLVNLRNIFFAQDLFHFMGAYTNFSFICGGDFNSILSILDVENGQGFPQKFSRQLSDIVQTNNLSDAFRYLYPASVEFTFFRASAASSRLDRFYLSNNLLSSIMNVEHFPSLSDHWGVLLSLKTDNLPKNVNSDGRSRGRMVYWKLNSAILKEEEFFENFSDFWQYLVTYKLSYSDVAIWWDEFVKPSLKEFCVLYSKRRSLRRRDTLNFWFAYLKTCLMDKNWVEVFRTKNIIKQMLSDAASGFQVRSRCQNVASDEASSIFFANQESRNAKRNSLEKLKINYSVVADEEEIEAEVLQFFNALFNGQHNADLVDTGSSFAPDFANLDDYLEGLSSVPNDIRDTLSSNMELEYVNA